MARYGRMFFSSVVFAMFCVVLMGRPAGAAEIYFEDDFNGAAIDPLKWNTDIATSGSRFCPTSVQYHHTYGNWQDVSTTPCNGSMQVPPYGYIQVADGAARFSSDLKRTFPYLWAGSPSRPSPFPTDGDFTLEIKMKYDALKSHGDGIIVFNAENTDPVGSNPAYPSGQNIYGIWADSSGLNGGGKVFPPYSPEAYAYHVYKLEYVSGNYSLYVDGAMVAGPNADGRRPNAIWIGNPVHTSWGISDWTDFTVEYVRVTVPSLSCVQPPADMIGWWPGDGSGNDIIGNRNGSPQGSAAYATGKVAEAFSFNGQNYNSVPDDDIWTLGNNPFTIDLWVKFNSLSGRDPFIAHDEGGGALNKWIFWYDALAVDHGHYQGCSGPALAFHINGPSVGGRDPICYSWQPEIGRWYHTAITRSGNTYSLYLDGVLVKNAVDFSNIPDPSFPLTIGRAESYLLNGQIDEMEVFDRALSAEEIRSLYLAGSAGKCKPENHSPVAEAGPDRTMEMTSCAGAMVTLDGSASSDPDGDALSYTWTENGGVIATGANPAVTLAYGSHTITLTVDDGKGGTATDEVVIAVADTTAPALNVTLNPNVLWPPNHKYVKVSPSITVSDACVETVQISLLTASSSEPDNGLGDGDMENDIVVNVDGTISLRAERSGKGSGRVYTITYQAMDAAGNTAAGAATVTVPHNK